MFIDVLRYVPLFYVTTRFQSALLAQNEILSHVVIVKDIHLTQTFARQEVANAARENTCPWPTAQTNMIMLHNKTQHDLI